MTGGEVLGWSASVGVAVAPARNANLSALLRTADQRMYAAKHRRDQVRTAPGGAV